MTKYCAHLSTGCLKCGLGSSFTFLHVQSFSPLTFFFSFSLCSYPLTGRSTDTNTSRPPGNRREFILEDLFEPLIPIFIPKSTCIHYRSKLSFDHQEIARRTLAWSEGFPFPSHDIPILEIANLFSQRGIFRIGYTYTRSKTLWIFLNSDGFSSLQKRNRTIAQRKRWIRMEFKIDGWEI